MNFGGSQDFLPAYRKKPRPPRMMAPRERPERLGIDLDGEANPFETAAVFLTGAVAEQADFAITGTFCMNNRMNNC